MASTKDYVDYVCERVNGFGMINAKKMFGEYMVYINAKPILLICDNTVYVKMLEEINAAMAEEETGHPYNGAKLHYILDVENEELMHRVVPVLEKITKIPVKKKKKSEVGV